MSLHASFILFRQNSESIDIPHAFFPLTKVLNSQKTVGFWPTLYAYEESNKSSLRDRALRDLP